MGQSYLKVGWKPLDASKGRVDLTCSKMIAEGDHTEQCGAQNGDGDGGGGSCSDSEGGVAEVRAAGTRPDAGAAAVVAVGRGRHQAAALENDFAACARKWAFDIVQSSAKNLPEVA